MEIIQVQGRVLQFFEWNHMWRTIWTDGRPLPKAPDPRFLGYSVGRWDGDTFVVESNGFDERTWLSENYQGRMYGFPHSDELRTVEHYKRVDHNTLDVSLTITDPKIFTTPWVTTGKFLTDRQKIATPRPALPDAVADVVKQLTTSFSWSGPTGITFPGVVTDGVTRTAANLDPAWIGLDAAALFGTATGNPVRVLNDADAAGVAEMRFGAGVDQKGTVLMLTFGTGIGSALFTGGLLVPNTEFGHIEIRGHDAETRASERAKELHDLSWGKWAGRVDEYLQHIEALLSPHLIIVGGGISKQSEKWVPRLTGIRARIVPAVLLNDAGIVGAAVLAAEQHGGQKH